MAFKLSPLPYDHGSEAISGSVAGGGGIATTASAMARLSASMPSPVTLEILRKGSPRSASPRIRAR